MEAISADPALGIFTSQNGADSTSLVAAVDSVFAYFFQSCNRASGSGGGSSSVKNENIEQELIGGANCRKVFTDKAINNAVNKIRKEEPI